MKTLMIAIAMLAAAPVAGSAEHFSAVRAYPNPVRVAAGQSTLTFDGLPAGARVQIFDLRGRLVIDEALDPAETGFAWNLRNDAGERVASGVYFYVLTDRDGNRYTDKVAVLR